MLLNLYYNYNIALQLQSWLIVHAYVCDRNIFILIM